MESGMKVPSCVLQFIAKVSVLTLLFVGLAQMTDGASAAALLDDPGGGYNVCPPDVQEECFTNICPGYYCTCSFIELGRLCFSDCEGCSVWIRVTVDCGVAAAQYDVSHIGQCESATRFPVFCPGSTTVKLSRYVLECTACQLEP
jgi:hypothetical protein